MQMLVRLGTTATALAGIVLAASADQRPPPSDAELARWIDQRVEERQPTKEDRRFDEIAWVRDIRTAQRLAKEHKRPVFLFTHDGRMNLGRC